MSKLQYETIPQLERRITEADLAEQKELAGDNGGAKLLLNKVTDNEIAEVVAAATGIPVSKMLQGERDKLAELNGQIDVMEGQMKELEGL